MLESLQGRLRCYFFAASLKQTTGMKPHDAVLQQLPH